MLRILGWLLAFGCTEEHTCTNAPASISVAIHVDPAIAAPSSLEVELATSETSRRETHGPTAEVRLAIAPAPEPGTEVTITVRAFEAMGTLPIAEGSARTTVNPDACNHVDVTLARRAAPIADAGATDAGATDASEPDAGDDAGADGGVDPLACAAEGRPADIFLHTFEDDALDAFADVLELHPGRIDPGPIRLAGRPDCGRALGFAGAGYGVVASSADFELDAGVLDFWVRLDGTPADAEGIVSRDALGTTRPGHLTVSRSCDNRIIARIQTTGDVNAYRCSDPIAEGAWAHVEVRFGAPNLELAVDGLASATASVAICGNTWIDCQAPFIGGIAGNENPWVYGASSVMSDEGQPTPLFAFFNGAIDSVRLSRR